LIYYDFHDSFRSNSTLNETVMAFNEYNRKPTFLDMEIQRGFENSRTRQILPEIDETIRWEPLEKIVAEHYPVGQSESGNKAYHGGGLGS